MKNEFRIEYQMNGETYITYIYCDEDEDPIEEAEQAIGYNVYLLEVWNKETGEIEYRADDYWEVKK